LYDVILLAGTVAKNATVEIAENTLV